MIDPSRIALVAGLILYGVFGVATPDRTTWLELILLGLLGVAFTPMMLARFTALQPPGLWLLLAWGISVPSVIGTLSGHAPSHIVRDLVPFVFCFVPLMMPAWNPRALEHLVMLLAFAFAVRAVWIAFDPPPLPLAPDYLYLANSPLILLAGLLAGQRFLTHPRNGRALAFGGIAALMLGVCLLYDLRAPSLLMSFGWLVLLILYRQVHPARGIGAVCVVVLLSGMTLMPEFSELVAKSERVGWNQRWAETHAILEVMGDHPFTLLFGTGWGARFSSPAVGMIEVGYTHNFLTYLFWKTGLVGLTAFGGLMWVAIRHSVGLSLDRAVITALVLIIPIGFYTTYKTLDFGLLIAVLTAWIRHSRPAIRMPSLRVQS